ncbi:MAG: threonine synthase [Candidatus Woesearchaeota archaeon]
MLEQILYHSTNRNLSLEQLKVIKDIDPNIKGAFKDLVTFKDTILWGQSPDTGLFNPVRLPTISLEEISSLKGKPPSDTGYLILRKFLTEEEMPDAVLRKLCKEAFNFEYPLEHLEDRKFLLMHTKSPTGDFKNTGARANARFLSYFMEPGMIYIRNTITSGDTGGAVGLADYLIRHLISVIWYPKDYISKVQKYIIDRIGGNVYALAVEGVDFTPIQDQIGKALLADSDLRQELLEMKVGLTSGNSINWGRVLPQLIHFVHAYAQLASPVGEPAIFSTPLGNMGHGLAGDIARRMGLPIFSVWPTNENDPFPRYLQTGVYKPLTAEQVNLKCKSNSMIVKNPSNAARLFDFEGGNVDKDGRVNGYPSLPGIQKHIYSAKVMMGEEDEAIKYVFKQYGIHIDPHGACAFHGFMDFANKEKLAKDMLSIIQVTAHPYKYEDHVRELTGEAPKKPEQFEWFDNRPESCKIMPFDYAVARQFILDLAYKQRQIENRLHA